MNKIEQKAITTIRMLAAEAVEKAKSGHPGLPIGAAPMAFALWKQMRHNPGNINWAGRDRFVLSAGHASMLQYALLHLWGYDVTMDDIKNFRQWDSKTPGHPEYGITPGVETTSGPLGQGIAIAVGMAAAEARLAEHFNRPGFPVVDNYTYAICGDGCLQEGVSAEAASFAGTMKLGKLIVLYDRNHITIEGRIESTFDEDVGKRFEAYGWQVLEVASGEDIDAISYAIAEAKSEKNKPTLIIVTTDIAYGTPKQGKASAHGEPLGKENITAMREFYKWDYPEFTVPDDVREYFDTLKTNCEKEEATYSSMFKKYCEKYPELGAEWEAWHSNEMPEGLENDQRLWTADKDIATREASGRVLNIMSEYMPQLFGGSADLAPSNKSEIKGKPYFSHDCRDAVNIHYGIREFAMAAICNGIMLYGGLRAFCATFLVFSDYLKPALRLSALMRLPVIYVFTHDSIGVGEDGPTHQPIEHLAALRCVPDTLVFRPADMKETSACYLAALENGLPSAMVLSRQNLPQFAETSIEAKKGGYVLRDCDGTPDIILMGSGSEVKLIMGAAAELEKAGKKVRVVSMPCTNLFDKQSIEYQKSVLPENVRARVAVEAASTHSWYKYVGLDGKVIGIDHFGASAPANILFEKFGFTVDNVVSTALELVNK